MHDRYELSDDGDVADERDESAWTDERRSAYWAELAELRRQRDEGGQE